LAAPLASAGPVGSVWPIGKSPPSGRQLPSKWPPDFDPEAIKTCDGFVTTPYAVSDAPSKEELVGLAGCDAEALYYGIGMPVDFERARKCAFTRAEPSRDAVMGGAEILMMIYANGQGVPKNFDLALRFACTVGGAGAEISGRLSRLLAARTTGNLEDAMDVCDDVTSGYMSGYCAAHVERVAAVPRNARRRAASSTMPQVELKALDTAAARFFEARSTWEVDLTGTMRAVFSIEEQAKLEDELVLTLEHLKDATFVPPHADPKPLELELSKLMATSISRKTDSPATMIGSVTSGGIRKTQKQWLRYRDKLVELVRKVRPAAELDDWRASIIQSRLEQLRPLSSG
jgi:hypothetical protein